MKTLFQLLDHTLKEADSFGIKHMVYNTHGYCRKFVDKIMARKGFRVYETQGIMCIRSSGNSKFLEE